MKDWDIIGDFAKNPSNPGYMVGMSPNGTPQYPGAGFMPTPMDSKQFIDAMQQFIRCQKRIVGFQFTVQAGSTLTSKLDIDGTARIMLGFNLVGAGDEQLVSFSLQVNNDLVIQPTAISNLSSNFIDEEYYSIPRPLSGRDSVEVTFNNVGPQQIVTLAIFYI